MARPMTSRMDDLYACTQEFDTAMGRSDSLGSLTLLNISRAT